MATYLNQWTSAGLKNTIGTCCPTCVRYQTKLKWFGFVVITMARQKSFRTYLDYWRSKNTSLQVVIRKSWHIVCCGHTHHEYEIVEQDVHYLNSGCWTELPCHYVTVINGEAKLNINRSE